MRGTKKKTEDSQMADKVTKTADAISRLAQLCKVNNVKLLIVNIPDLRNLSDWKTQSTTDKLFNKNVNLSKIRDDIDNFLKVKQNNLHIGAATPINDILDVLKKYYSEFYEIFEP